MTRRDFVLIAEVIAKADVTDWDRMTMAGDFARRLKAENPNFDVDRFITAAGAS